MEAWHGVFQIAQNLTAEALPYCHIYKFKRLAQQCSSPFLACLQHQPVLEKILRLALWVIHLRIFSCPLLTYLWHFKMPQTPGGAMPPASYPGNPPRLPVMGQSTCTSPPGSAHAPGQPCSVYHYPPSSVHYVNGQPVPYPGHYHDPSYPYSSNRYPPESGRGNYHPNWAGYYYKGAPEGYRWDMSTRRPSSTTNWSDKVWDFCMYSVFSIAPICLFEFLPRIFPSCSSRTALFAKVVNSYMWWKYPYSLDRCNAAIWVRSRGTSYGEMDEWICRRQGNAGISQSIIYFRERRCIREHGTQVTMDFLVASSNIERIPAAWGWVAWSLPSHCSSPY